MEYLGFLGFIAFIMAASHSSLPGQVKSLERKIRILNKKIKGDNSMSKLLEELTGKRCSVKIEGELLTTGTILSVDEEWLKMDVEKDKENKIRLFKIDNINSFEVIKDDKKK